MNFREFSLLFSSFQTETKLRLHQSIHYSTSMKQDIIKDLKHLTKEQNKKSKIIISEGKKLEKDLKSYLESLEKVQNNFFLLLSF